MDVEQKKQRVQAVKTWFHAIDLGDDVITPGSKGGVSQGTKIMFDRLAIPADLSGKTVLDVGAWDGYNSFEAEKRGAERVVALDKFVWDWIGSDGFDTAHEILKSKVEKKKLDVYDINPDELGTFDIVFFLGVFYHLEDTMKALRNIASVTKEFCILESEVTRRFGPNAPYAVFCEGDSYLGDPSNWWVPNTACLVSMLREVGFKKIEVVHETYYGRYTRYMKWLDLFEFLVRKIFDKGRVVIHAYK